nr:putative F-box protein At1g19160 [Ipomoea batatas]
MDEEVFGTIELPSNVIIASFTIMNETIALLGYSTVGDSSCIEIWLMIENDNNTYWHKQAIIDCVVNVDNNERWRALGIWNVDNELLVFLDTTLHWDPFFDEMEVPYFISIDLVTQERKMFFISKERKSITVASDQVDGYVQVYNVREYMLEFMVKVYIHCNNEIIVHYLRNSIFICTLCEELCDSEVRASPTYL